MDEEDEWTGRGAGGAEEESCVWEYGFGECGGLFDGGVGEVGEGDVGG